MTKKTWTRALYDFDSYNIDECLLNDVIDYLIRIRDDNTDKQLRLFLEDCDMTCTYVETESDEKYAARLAAEEVEREKIKEKAKAKLKEKESKKFESLKKKIAEVERLKKELGIED